MYFGNIAAGKFYDRGGAIAGRVWRRQNLRASGFRLVEGRAEILHLVSSQFVPERIREMTIRDQDLRVAEQRCDSYTAIGFSRASDFSSVGMLVIRDYPGVGGGHESANKVISLAGRNIDSVVGNRFERRGGGGCEVPIELHLHAARPLYDRVDSDWVFEGLDDDLCSGRASFLDRLIHVGDQESGALLAEREGDRRLVGEDRKPPYRSQHNLKLGTAGSWRDTGDHSLGGLTPEGGDE